jgi:hypothetical protein
MHTKLNYWERLDEIDGAGHPGKIKYIRAAALPAAHSPATEPEATSYSLR